MMRMTNETFEKATADFRLEESAMMVSKMKEVVDIFGLYVYDADEEWTTTKWVDQDGYIHLIPHPVTRTVTREEKQELNKLYNNFYQGGYLATGLSAMTNAFEEKYGLDIYQIAGTLMAGSVSVNWSTCYIGALVALLCSCK